MSMCKDCIFINFCSSDVTVLLNDCWASVDNDCSDVDICLDKGSDSGSWMEMSYRKIDKSSGNWGCIEKSEWDLFVIEESKLPVLV